MWMRPGSNLMPKLHLPLGETTLDYICDIFSYCWAVIIFLIWRTEVQLYLQPYWFVLPLTYSSTQETR